MQITDKKYFGLFNERVGQNLSESYEVFSSKNKSHDFDFLLETSAVFSSNIEGNSIDLNTFMNYKLSKNKFLGKKEIEEIENLSEAYHFAKNNLLSQKAFLEAHKIFSKTFLIKSKRGKYREEPIGVFSEKGLVYLAVEPQFVKNEMNLFFEQIHELLNSELNVSEVFYFAALIHLRLAHIHPFTDGNGRATRLLEKWFLAHKLGENLWALPSEKFYKQNQNQYYTNIHLGANFYELNYDNCLPFIQMLPNSFIN